MGNTRNKYFIIISILLLFLISIASADPLPCSDVSQFDNCGLETGDFTGWTVPLELPSDIAVTSYAAYYENYGAVLKPADISDGDGYTYNYPSFSTGHVDLNSRGNITSISFRYKINKSQVSGNGANELRIFVPVGGEGILVLMDDINTAETGWEYYSITGEDLYAYLAETQPGWNFAPSFYISFEGSTYKPEDGAGTASLEVFIDEVTITFDDLSYVEFINGGFEYGNLTGWSTNEDGIVCGDCGGTVVVEEAAKYTGVYGLRLNGSITFPDQNYDGVAQRIPIDFESITIKYNVIDDSGDNANNNVYCYIVTDEGNWFEIFDVSSPITNGWNNITLSKTGIEILNGNSDWGSGTDAWIMVEARTAATGSGTSDFTVYIDDINPPLSGPTPTPTPTPTPVPTSTIMVNSTVGYSNTSIQVDVVNSTYMKDWLYYLMISNKSSIWDFPVIGFAGSVMGPFTDAFKGLGAGNLIYLILWGLFIMMVWRQAGKITIPAMIAVITAGAWSLLIPESAQPWCSILLCAAIASQLLTFFAKE